MHPFYIRSFNPNTMKYYIYLFILDSYVFILYYNFTKLTILY